MSLKDRFRALAEEFCDRASAEGLSLMPYRDSTWERFDQLELARQEEKYSHFERYYAICSQSTQEGLKLKGGLEIVSRILWRLKLRPCDENYRHLDDSHVIEIYSADLTQIYRNVTFLEACSYPLIDLYIYEWTELYRRPEEINRLLFEALGKASSLRPLRTVDCSQEVPDHILEEVFSPGRRKFIIKQGIVTPLVDTRGECAAYLASLQAKTLGASDVSVHHH